MKFSKVLVANRGEIAVRVMQTAKAMGYQTVAVYSDADSHARHVQEADEAVYIGASKVSESYLSITKIIDACKKTGADAVHPGYGFLSENTDFAQACIDNQITFIGPTASSIELMGSKRLSKIAMIEAGVPCVPGYEGDRQDLEYLATQAEQIGFPIMVKASAGGGGRGMRLVSQASDLQRALEGAHQEAKAAFGDGRLLLERALLTPRHIEIQILADTHGHIIHLGERDCSVQRRHQKLIEEAPSPAVNPALRRRLGDAAVAIARAVNYVGLGTVEFLLDTSDADHPAFYFIEMNTRLQVEHPVTEALIGEDLVKWQLRVATGEMLTLNQNEVLERFEHGGHAIEARLCAEDPAADYLPQSGRLLYWLPAPELRCDAALQSGQPISPHYDSMLAKLIAHAPTRALAIARLADGLERTVCLGLINNRGFLVDILRSPVFGAGEFDTERLHRDATAFSSAAASPQLHAIAAWLIACLPRIDDGLGAPWWNWRSTGVFDTTVPLGVGDDAQSWRVLMQVGMCTVSDDTHHFHIEDVRVASGEMEANEASLTGPSTQEQSAALSSRTLLNSSGRAGCGSIDLSLDGTPMSVFFAWEAHTFWLQYLGTQIKIVDQRLQSAAAQSINASNAIRAPMHGRIVQIEAQDNGSVSNGQLVVIMEAMKMEHHLLAPSDAQIEHVRVRIGDQVSSGQVLITLQLP